MLQASALLAVLVSLLIALPGCRSARSEAAGPVEIVYWTGWGGHELEVQEELVADFNRAHPGIRVRILSVYGSFQKVRIAFAGGDTPDVCSAVWPDELAGYAMRGLLTPLDDYLHASGRKATEWVPAGWELGRYHDRTWGLVGTINADFVLYNKAAFEARGLRPPRTLQEWLQVNAACMERGPNGFYKTYGMRPSGLINWGYIFGGHWYEPKTGRITATHPRNVEALRFLQAFARENDIKSMETFESTFGSMTTTSAPFFVGKELMVQGGTWMEEFINRYAPEDFRYGWFAYPPPPGGRAMCSVISSSVFVIPSASRHKSEAWTFINWLMQPAQNKRFCLGIGNGSPLKVVAASPEMQGRPMMRFASRITGGPNAFGPPQMPIWPTYQAAVSRAEDIAVHGGGDPEALLREVQRKVEMEMRRAQRDAVY